MKNKYRILAIICALALGLALIGYETGRVADPGEYVYPLCGGGYTPVATTQRTATTRCIAGPAYGLRNDHTVLDIFLGVAAVVVLATINEARKDLRKRKGRAATSRRRA